MSYNSMNGASFTVASIPFDSTTVSGGINTASAVTALSSGDRILIGLDAGADSGGIVNGKEYYVRDLGSNTLKLSTTVGGTAVVFTANAGSGDIYPNYPVHGSLWVGNSGDIYARGMHVTEGSSTGFSLLKNVANGTHVDLYIKDVNASGTTASNMVPWSRQI